MSNTRVRPSGDTTRSRRDRFPINADGGDTPIRERDEHDQLRGRSSAPQNVYRPQSPWFGVNEMIGYVLNVADSGQWYPSQLPPSRRAQIDNAATAEELHATSELTNSRRRSYQTTAASSQAALSPFRMNVGAEHHYRRGGPAETQAGGASSEDYHQRRPLLSMAPSSLYERAVYNETGQDHPASDENITSEYTYDAENMGNPRYAPRAPESGTQPRRYGDERLYRYRVHAGEEEEDSGAEDGQRVTMDELELYYDAQLSRSRRLQELRNRIEAEGGISSVLERSGLVYDEDEDEDYDDEDYYEDEETLDDLDGRREVAGAQEDTMEAETQTGFRFDSPSTALPGSTHIQRRCTHNVAFACLILIHRLSTDNVTVLMHGTIVLFLWVLKWHGDRRLRKALSRARTDGIRSQVPALALGALELGLAPLGLYVLWWSPILHVEGPGRIFLFQPPKKSLGFWLSIWLVVVSDHVICCVCIAYKSVVVLCHHGISALRGIPATLHVQGAILTFTEHLFLLYRLCLPSSVWWAYFVYRPAENSFLSPWVTTSVVVVYLYMVVQAVRAQLVDLWKAAKMIWMGNRRYGRDPSPAELEEYGNHCAICYGEMNEPIALDCSHLFCEDCLAEWLVRGHSSCPVCRAEIRESDALPPMYADGSTSTMALCC
mmetsp:Transcript_5716/g.20807  ORF Transcript_5716/g.20807 Transcript_5716/m.20807 type:complete len:661 (+) Transcript_5716:244-2226(+)